MSVCNSMTRLPRPPRARTLRWRRIARRAHTRLVGTAWASLGDRTTRDDECDSDTDDAEYTSYGIHHDLQSFMLMLPRVVYRQFIGTPRINMIARSTR